ncbi:ABC transporter ATP-binding protein [Globicatella sanguinis]|uniref:ABC transporter ATP-binding protein n=1 Tax=Globicatella sanguinis TaxID=13076 RepID=UPI002542B9D7|nr:ABC transporter ATP-binding protein [Globicatella sanguinis]MDK7630859.1 ABC transporter ATP-binding protein [Globicatella sanguinis]WIK67325.1 ABC transporter ATP-binding protein [Globicatella sanguinis]WKT56730.1 ABC transporter ATP-binding protein [Globicatella sanguinis]
MSLVVKNMSSGYRGIPVLKKINFTIPYGEIVGLIGLNGAGKSTLLKTILGLIKPIEGQITIGNQTINEHQSQFSQQLAYIPETPVLYEELTLKEHLEMTALGYGLPIETVMERAKPLLKLFRLENHLNWFPIHFSKGMKQKVMIICAMVTDAKVMIIDEPFLGLDPLAIKHFTELLQQRAQQGTAIIFTTHVLMIAEQLCDQYLMLQAGEIIAKGDLKTIQEQFRQPEATLDELYVQMTEAAQ